MNRASLLINEQRRWIGNQMAGWDQIAETRVYNEIMATKKFQAIHEVVVVLSIHLKLTSKKGSRNGSLNKVKDKV